MTNPRDLRPAQRALDAYRTETGSALDDDETATADLIADLMHLADALRNQDEVRAENADLIFGNKTPEQAGREFRTGYSAMYRGRDNYEAEVNGDWLAGPVDQIGYQLLDCIVLPLYPTTKED